MLLPKDRCSSSIVVVVIIGWRRSLLTNVELMTDVVLQVDTLKSERKFSERAIITLEVLETRKTNADKRSKLEKLQVAQHARISERTTEKTACKLRCEVRSDINTVFLKDVFFLQSIDRSLANMSSGGSAM